VVQDQNRIGITQLVDHVLPHIVAHRIGVPDRITQQPLHPVRRGVSSLLSQLPTRTGIHIGQRAEQERPRPAARLDTTKLARNAGKRRVELLQPLLCVYPVSQRPSQDL
jgi:hypothetical protein